MVEEKINWGIVMFDVSIVIMATTLTIYFNNYHFLWLLIIAGTSGSTKLNKKGGIEDD